MSVSIFTKESDKTKLIAFEKNARDALDDLSEKKVEAIEPDRVPPPQIQMDGGYGWVVVFAIFLVLFNSTGLNAAFGIYLSYYLNYDVFPGGTKLDYAMIGGISFGLGTAFSPVINYFQGKVGTRYTIMIGAVIQFAALIMSSFAVNLWELYLTQGVIQSIGLAMVNIPALTVVSQWFSKKKVLANGLAVTGSGAGGLFYNLVLQKIIDVKGYEWALRASAIISLVLITVAVLLIRTRTSQHSIQFTFLDKQCLQSMGFWLLVLYLMTCMLGYIVVMFSMANYTTSLGYTEKQGAIVSAMIQVSFCCHCHYHFILLSSTFLLGPLDSNLQLCLCHCFWDDCWYVHGNRFPYNCSHYHENRRDRQVECCILYVLVVCRNSRNICRVHWSCVDQECRHSTPIR